MPQAEGTTFRFDVFDLPPGVDLLYRDQQVVQLEPRAVRVLRYLVEHNDRVLSKEEILEEVWSDVFTTDGVLKKAVSQIRRTLGDDAEQSRFIATYHGRGYRFIAPVTRAAQARSAPGTVTVPQPDRGDLIPNYDQLAGRESELLTLRAELRSALEGNPRPVVITGEPGIGKTQLARRFRRWALEQGAVSLYGRFFDYRGARLAPYEMFIDLLRTAASAGNGRGAERSAQPAEAIEAACGVRLPPELFTDANAPIDPFGGGIVSDPFRLVMPIVRAFLALARRQPMVIVLDDVQWADSASLDVIGCLMRALESEPLMLIMLVRSNEAESAEHPIRSWLEEHAVRRAYTTLPLEHLDASACREVIGAIFGTRRSGEVPRADLDALFQLTDGNPYFLVETLRLLVAGGAIAPDLENRRWTWKGISDLALPQTIVTAVRAKIDRLSDDVRAVVDQAAVLGDEFRVATLCRLTGQDERSIEQILSEAVRAGVLSIQALSAGEDCRFQHSILRHVVYDAIAPHRRRALHARAAETLEAIYSDERDRIAEALAAHYSAAGDLRRALETAMVAWRRARTRFEWRKAAALIERAEETARTLEEAHEPLAHEQRMALLLAHGETWCAVGRTREAAAVIDRAVAQATSGRDDHSLARAYFLRALAAIARSNYGDARVALCQALDHFLKVEDPTATSRTIVQLAVVEAAVGNYDRVRLLVEQVRGSSALENVLALADGLVGWSLALEGRYAEGAELLEKALAYYDRAGDVRERALLLRRLHWTCLSRGDYETAIQLAIRAREASATVGDVSGEARANLGIGQARLEQANYDEAISFLRRAIEQLQTAGDAHCEAECLWLLGRAQYETGNLDEATGLLDRGLAMVRQIGDRDDEFRILTDVARLQILRGNLDAACTAARSAHDLATSLGNREGSALAALELARVDLARGHVSSAREATREAAEVLEKLGSNERRRVLSLLAQMEAAGPVPRLAIARRSDAG
jgi:DNA-binding winged helix-turn-helix (wHTH) protein/tetratricopeptide (TPR) repeat protein